MVKQGQLIIYLNARDLANPSWATDAAIHYGAMDQLAEAAKERDVIVIVPAADVLLTTVNLPKMSRVRLMQALPFALEEQLIADVEDLHFAVGDYQTDGSLPVAVISKEKMQQWMQLLQEWQVQPTIMTTAALILPVSNNTWHIFVDNVTTIRVGNYAGFVSENENLKTLLSVALKEAQQTPQKIHFHNFTSHAYASSFTSLVTVEEEFVPTERKMEHISALCDTTNVINLLQGDYAPKRASFPKIEVKWKVAVYLAIACLATLILYPAISYTILKYRLVVLDSQINAIYKRHFPQAKNTIAPKARLQEKLESLMAEVGQNRLLFLLGYVGKGLAETTNVKLKRFDFHNNQLTLEITAATSEDLTSLNDYLSQQGLSVKQQSADVTGSRLQATMVIE